jgi:hypothetical protein
MEPCTLPSLQHEQSPNERRHNSIQRAKTRKRKDTIKHHHSLEHFTSSPPQKPPHRKPSCLAQTRNHCTPFTRVSSYRPDAPLTIGGGLTIDRHHETRSHPSVRPPSRFSNPVNSPEHPRDHTTNDHPKPTPTLTAPEESRARQAKRR